MTPSTDAILSSAEYKDRKAGLVIFGILTTLGGGMCALFVPLMLAGQAMSAKAGVPQSFQAIVPAVAMYGVLAVMLVWLGIGSMMARRWARALLLIFSWSWLLVGVVSLSVMTWVLPHMFEGINAAAPPGQPEMPEAAKSAVMISVVIVFGVMFILMPTVWVFFYQSRHVKATCEACDPTMRWTDRCPLPVIAVSLWLAYCVPMMLVMTVAYKSAIPLFGTFIVGPLGAALYLALAIVWSYSAWALYKRDRCGWWLIVASTILFSISAVMTYFRHDVTELYVLMGYPEQQIAQMRKLGLFQGRGMAWVTLAGAVPFLGYMLYLRRFFPFARK